MGGGVLVVRVLVHGGDREHSRGGVTCTVAAAVGSLALAHLRQVSGKAVS
jgi:hypothetical protein